MSGIGPSVASNDSISCELRRLEQNHHIPPLAPNLKAAVDELFKIDPNQ